MRKPFIKFICNSSSYFTFLCKLIIEERCISDGMEIILDLILATGPVPLNVLIFAVLLILASQRIEDIMGWDLDTDTTKVSRYLQL